MNEQENLALKTGFMGEKKRDASSSIRGFVYQNLLAIPLSMEKEIFREMYCQYLKLINDGNLHSVIPVLSIFSEKMKV